jgi:starch phosphorylase
MRARLATEWSDVRFESLDVFRESDAWHFRATVDLGRVPPEWVRAEVWADEVGGNPRTREPMTPLCPDDQGRQGFEARIASARPATDFTPRLIAWHQEARLPAELPFIRWQR